MGTVVSFPAIDHHKPPAQDRHGDAEVIIFPGVRIERREFNLKDRLAGPSSPPASARLVEEVG